MRSKVFTFVIGPDEKEFNIHAAALSGLSRPLSVLLEGPFKEARECRVAWPEVDESTFVRFSEWAYTRDYVVAEPVISPVLRSPKGKGRTKTSATVSTPEKAPYSLSSYSSSVSSTVQTPSRECCRNPACDYYQQDQRFGLQMVLCSKCHGFYASQVCSGLTKSRISCGSVFNDCFRPSCANNRKAFPGSCSDQNCEWYGRPQQTVNDFTLCCFCKVGFMSGECVKCLATLSECPRCPVEGSSNKIKKSVVVEKFMNGANKIYPPLDVPYQPRKNVCASEDYTEVFLCHAKLYHLGDFCDIPALRQLSFHRLYATLQVFVLYPARIGDIATFARYLFENTPPDDQIRDVVTSYYACIIEDVSQDASIKALIDDLPDFASALIDKMSARLC